MGILRALFGGQKRTSPDPVREALFGDCPLDRWPPEGEASDEFPWSAFVAARQTLAAGTPADAIAEWRRVLASPGLEPRHYLQAWHFLREHGEEPPPAMAKQLLGVVIEVAMPQGLDLLAAYSARYVNHSGASVVWEHPDTSLDSAMDDLFEASRQVVAQIGPWDRARPAPPPRNAVRLSFLTPSGLHFGEGPIDALSRDPLGGRVLHLASALMGALIAQAASA